MEIRGRKRKPCREWLFEEEDENKWKKKEITWENGKGKGNRNIIEKKEKGKETNKNN